MHTFRSFALLACDYDGTLARGGVMEDATVQALQRVRRCGRRLALLTGRELRDLHRVCPHLGLFDRVVAENGAVLYRPSTGEVTMLARRPPLTFIRALRRRGVRPISVGAVVVATHVAYLAAAQAAIEELQRPLEVVLNKESLMILPRGVDKASGLRQIAAELGIPGEKMVAVGDAENDQPMLRAAGFAVAVANALPEIKRCSHLVTTADHGAGVREALGQICCAE